jgi:hypothetical protein
VREERTTIAVAAPPLAAKVEIDAIVRERM